MNTTAPMLPSDELAPILDAARDDLRPVLVLARSVFRRLIHAGFRRHHLVAFVTELLDLELKLSADRQGR